MDWPGHAEIGKRRCCVDLSEGVVSEIEQHIFPDVVSLSGDNDICKLSAVVGEERDMGASKCNPESVSTEISGQPESPGCGTCLYADGYQVPVSVERKIVEPQVADLLPHAFDVDGSKNHQGEWRDSELCFFYKVPGRAVYPFSQEAGPFRGVYGAGTVYASFRSDKDKQNVFQGTHALPGFGGNA